MPPADITITTRLNVEDIEALAVSETQTHPVPSMVFIVKKPDYLGSSMWELRHGRKTIFARIEHEEWLKEFQGRRVDVRPGDALRCQVRIEMLYGHDNELIAEKYYIEKVHAVLENQYSQPHPKYREWGYGWQVYIRETQNVVDTVRVSWPYFPRMGILWVVTIVPALKPIASGISPEVAPLQRATNGLLAAR